MPTPAFDRVTLSTRGSDRATAYTMSPKLAQLGDAYVVTWQDVSRVNQWALVDIASGAVRGQGPVGPQRQDNHCTAALVTSPAGEVHLVVSGHHEPFNHYRGVRKGDTLQWECLSETLGEGATYPSIACGPDGVLHMAYRCKGWGGTPYPYRVAHAQWRPGQGWAAPRPVVQVNVLEHTWTQNTLTLGPDGTIHIALANTLPMENGAKYYGVSHVFSPDAGRLWYQAGRPEPLATSVPACDLNRVEGEGLSDARTELNPTRPFGAVYSSYMNQMGLSNVVVTPDGVVRLLVLNPMGGDVRLASLSGSQWSLRDVPPPPLEGYRYTHFATLACDDEGLDAVITSAPGDRHEYGQAATALVHIRFAGEEASARLVRPPLDERAQWLPSLEFCRSGPRRPLGLMYTVGVPAARGMDRSNNLNTVEAEVVLEILKR